MLKIFLKKISVYLSFYYFNIIKNDQNKHKKISIFLKKEINNKYKINPRLKTHIKLSKEIFKIVNEKKLNNFLRNSIVQNIFFIHNRFFIFKELNELKRDRNWNLWKKMLIENNVGNPIRYFLYPKTSGNRIRQVYILKKFLDIKKNIKIGKIKNIIELGGGYGCMAQIFYDLKALNNYYIYDMYEVNLLQYYYLKMNNCRPNLFKDNRGIALINDMKHLKEISKNKKVDLFIANWSLSEFPLNFRKEFIPIIGSSNYSIISFQEKFEKINNSKFFKNLVRNLHKKYTYKFIDFDHYNRSPFNNTNHCMLVLSKK